MSNKSSAGFGGWYRRLSGKLLELVATPQVLGELPEGLHALKNHSFTDTAAEAISGTTPAMTGATTLSTTSKSPVCYVMFEHSMSNALLVDSEARRQGLPAPLDPLHSAYLQEKSSLIYLKHGDEENPFRTPHHLLPPKLLHFVDEVIAHDDLDIQLVPVTILWGRAPDKEDSIFKLLFADSWATPSVLKQSVNIAIHGRQTFIQFHDPLSLRELIEQQQTSGISEHQGIAGHIVHELRAYLTRQREVVLGPDLSDRRNVVEDLMNSPAVNEAIKREMSHSQRGYPEVRFEAYGYLDEIASDYSYSAIRFFDRSLTWLWTQLFEGVEVHHFQSVRQIADEYELIYAPSHRSHVDYLLLSYVVFKRGMMIPYIAAGDNLNLPGVGALLRRGGAFFIRRTFKGNPLYTSVFKEYLHSILLRNNPIEYFIEGGRSRTGRLLPPKTGMLSMTVHSHLRGSGKPIAFIPVYFGYERLMEGSTYVGEMSGKPKESESVWGLIQVARRIERIFGKVHVSFGEPVFLDQVLKAHGAEHLHIANSDDPLPIPARQVVDTVAETIMCNINRAAVLNPISLLSLVLLATPKHALDEEICIKQLDTYRRLAEAVPYDDRIEITPLSGKDIIAYGMKLKFIKRVKHLLGDMIAIDDNQGVLLTYFRNNVVHLFILPSLIASLVQHNGRITREEVRNVIHTLYPFLQAELFLKWRSEMLDTVIEEQIDALIKAELVLDDGGNALYSPQPNSEIYNQLAVLGAPVQQSLERYFMTMSLISQQGSGRITTKQVEDLSHLLGQRLSVLYEFNSPEFFDKALFRSFISELIELKYINVDDQGIIHFDHHLTNMAQDARLVLNEETLKAVQHMTNVSEDEIQSAIAALAKKKDRKPKAK